MAEKTEISWCDSTFNPWTGCAKVSPGCDACYAEAWSKRAGDRVGKWGPGAPRVRTTPANWRKPLKWNAEPFFQCTGCGWRGESSSHPKYTDICGNPLCFGQDLKPARRRVFCSSLADVFDNEVDLAWRTDLFDLIAQTPALDWLVLTKRIGNAERMIQEAITRLRLGGWKQMPWPWPNVWLGATIVNQEEAYRDIQKLLAVPARVRFLSMEPLLGAVDLTRIPIGGHGYHEFDPIITANALKRAESYPPLPQVDWVIVGGESGPKARPMSPEWARGLRDQCAAAGVAFHLKQITDEKGRKTARETWPVDLQVPQEFPHGTWTTYPSEAAT